MNDALIIGLGFVIIIAGKVIGDRLSEIARTLGQIRDGLHKEGR